MQPTLRPLNQMKTDEKLPWKVSDSISSYLDIDSFPVPLGAVALGANGEEDTTWLIHQQTTKYCISKIERGGVVSSVEEHVSHPLALEGQYHHPLAFGVHMDATALYPKVSFVIDWLSRLCDREPNTPFKTDELAVGDVIFTGDKWAVRALDRSPWSHAALYVGSGYVAEAMLRVGTRAKSAHRLWNRGGVYRTSAHHFLEKGPLAVLRHPNWQLLSSEKFQTYSSLGWSDPYSIPSAARSLLSKWRLSRPGRDGVFCSHFVLAVYYRLGIPELTKLRVDPRSLTPGDLFKLLQDIGFQTVTIPSRAP